MIVCDRCRRPARLFAYGDFINEDYKLADLCQLLLLPSMFYNAF